MTVNRHFIRIFTLLMFPVLSSAGDNGDEFTNNLFSDLAPMLALFGERFAQQFMMGWLDHIIMAMAPLGILTAMVAAIRLGGPSWLKAIVGRARENKATAEIELMSSTSHEVGELWNGQTIVRTLGSPEIQQLVYLEDSNDKTGYGLYSMPVAEAKEYLCRKPYEDPLVTWCHRSWAKISGLFIRHQPKSDVETGNSRGGTPSSPHTLSSGDFEGGGGSLKAAPNISLNLHGGSKTEDLCFTALCGILLQFGVLAMSGLAVYHPGWKLQFQKNGAPVLGYAYPIMSIGTVILVSGIMICSAVVEQSTYETKWVEGRKYGNLFRKQSQTNLQTPTHGSSAEVARPSWELTDSESSTLSAESALLSIKSASDTEEQSDSIIQNIENTSHVSSALAWVGFSAGAIANPWPLQLPPKLRARVLWLQKSHTVSDQRFDAFVIIAQELRNVILTSRRSRNTLEDNLRLHDEPDEQSTGQRKPRRIASNSLEAFTVAGVGLSLVGFILQFQGLRGLHWSASISQLVAIFLVTALRAWVRRGLIAEPSAYRVLDGYQMDWLALHMTADPKLWMKDGPAEQNLDGSKPGESNTAAMSGGKFATPSGSTSTKAESIPEWFIITDPPQYACQGSWSKADVHTDTTHNGDAQKTMKIRQRLGYLTRWTGPASIPAISVARAIAMVMEKLSITAPPDCQSFSWYLDVRFIDLQDQLQFTVSACEEKCNSWVVDATEIESAISLWAFYIQSNEKHELMKDVHSSRNAKGHGNNDWLQEDTLLRRQTRRLLGPASEALMMDLRLWVGEGVDPVPLNRKDDKGLLVGFQGLGSTAGQDVLYVLSEAPLEQLLAQHIFSAFMWAIARYISKDRIHSNDTVVKVATDAETVETHVFSKLENKPLLELANSIHKAGLGSLEDTLLCIIPPLSCEDKLPVDTVVDFVRQQTRSQELSGNWGSVIARHGELVKFCSKFGIRHLLSFRAAAALVDLCRVVSETLKLWEDQRRRGEEVETLKHLKQNLRNDMSSLDEECVSHLVEMMKMRFEICDDLKSLCTSSEARSSRAHKFFGHSEFLKVFEDDLYSPRTPINTQAAPASPLRASQEDDLKWFRESGGEIEEQGVNTVDIFKWTPLHYVGLTGNDILMKKLLRLKADVKARDIAEYTPLHYASERGHESAVKQLLDRGADIDAQGRDGMSSIHLAAKLGHFKVVRLLLQRQARADIHDNARRTPLHWAAYNGRHGVVDLLLQNNASIDARDDYERTPLLLATLGWNKNNKTIQKLLECHADKNAVDRDKRTALHLAAEKNHSGLVEFLLNGRAGEKLDMEALDTDGRTPLHLLATAGHESVCKILLDQGADILIEDNDGMTAIHLAAANGHHLLLDSFLNGSCPGLDDIRFIALQLAVNNGRRNVVTLLLNQSFNVKYLLSVGNLLHKAAERGHEEVIRCLLEFGAEIHETDDKLRTPLEVAAAAEPRKQSIIKIFVDKVRDILLDGNLDRPSRAILEATLRQQRFDITALLLQAKVVKDDINQPLLRRAMHLKVESMVEFLINTIVIYGSTLSEISTARISIGELAWAQHELQSFSMINSNLAFRKQSTVTTFELFNILWCKLRSKEPERTVLQDPWRNFVRKEPEIPVPLLCAQILDCEEFWLQTTAEKSEEIAVDEDDNDEPYVVALVAARSPSPVRKIRFIMRSHDQGWCEERGLKGEYEGSWTWFEAGVRGGTKLSYDSSSEQLRDGVQAGELSGAMNSEGSGSIVTERPMIQPNVRANKASREHIVTWNRQDMNTEQTIREWMAKIRPGDTVCVYPKARFPAWVNYVEYVKIEVFCAWG